MWLLEKDLGTPCATYAKSFIAVNKQAIAITENVCSVKWTSPVHTKRHSNSSFSLYSSFSNGTYNEIRPKLGAKLPGGLFAQKAKERPKSATRAIRLQTLPVGKIQSTSRKIISGWQTLCTQLVEIVITPKFWPMKQLENDVIFLSNFSSSAELKCYILLFHPF